MTWSTAATNRGQVSGGNYPARALALGAQPAAVADLMEQFYRDGPGATETVADLQKMPPKANDDHVCERFTVTMTDGSKRLLCVPFDEGGGRVDFKSYACQCSDPWSAVLDGTVAEADPKVRPRRGLTKLVWRVRERDS